MARPFEARYDGWCSPCGEQILEGDEVIYDDNEVVHVDCTSADVDTDDSDMFG